MTQTYFRIQTADRDVTELLDPGHQFSSAYNRVGSLTRRGVSTCDSLDDLAEYLASGAATAIQPRTDGTWVIVELEGEVSPDAPVDEYEILVIPTAVVAVRPVDYGFMDLVEIKTEFLTGFAAGPTADFDDES